MQKMKIRLEKRRKEDPQVQILWEESYGISFLTNCLFIFAGKLHKQQTQGKNNINKSRSAKQSAKATN